MSLGHDGRATTVGDSPTQVRAFVQRVHVAVAAATRLPSISKTLAKMAMLRGEAWASSSADGTTVYPQRAESAPAKKLLLLEISMSQTCGLK